MSNHIHYSVWDEITYIFPNFNGATVLLRAHTIFLWDPDCQFSRLSKASWQKIKYFMQFYHPCPSYLLVFCSPDIVDSTCFAQCPVQFSLYVQWLSGLYTFKIGYTWLYFVFPNTCSISEVCLLLYEAVTKIYSVVQYIFRGHRVY